MTGYVVKMFPRFSETFILAEILELERRGEKIHVISLRKPDDGCFHEDLSRVRAAVAYLPEHLTCQPLEYLRAHARACLRSPKAYLRALFAAVSQLPASWRGFLRAPLVAAEACRRSPPCLRPPSPGSLSHSRPTRRISTSGADRAGSCGR